MTRRVDVEAHIGAELAALRRMRGLSLRQVAKACGVSAATIYRIECGDGNPTLNNIMDVAKALGGRIHLSIPPR